MKATFRVRPTEVGFSPLPMLIVVVLAVWVFLADPADAATGVVGSGSPPSCTGSALTAQIAMVPAGGTISFNCGGIATIALSSGITIGASTTINGGGVITLSGGSTVRPFLVNSGATLTLQAITISAGTADSTCNFSGGAVCVSSGATLTATNATFSGNFAVTAGGAIENLGIATLSRVSILGSAASANGGGIDSHGSLTLSNSTVAGNRADGFDNGGFPFPNNTYGGAGISNFGSATVTNSTLASNSTYYGEGGAIRNSGSMTVRYSTIAFNSSGFGTTTLGFGDGGGIQGSATIQSTVLAGNYGAGFGNCGINTTVTSQGYNLSDDASCSLGQPGDIVNTPANLQYRANNNGGPYTDATGAMGTVLPLAGSPAIDAIPNGSNGCGSTYAVDQRGQARPANGGINASRCDIGALETQPTPPATTGTVIVSKYLVGPQAGNVPGSTQYKLSLTCGSTVLGPFNVLAGGNVSIPNVPVGNCTLSENTAALPSIAGVGWAAPIYLPNAVISITGGLTTAATVGNTANARGSVIVSKVVNGPAMALGLVPDYSYHVFLTCGSTVLGPQEVYNNGSTTFLNAPAGSCTVSEEPPGSTGNYAWVAPVFTPSASVTVTAAGTQQVAVTNTAILPPNSVLVTKTLQGSAASYVSSYDSYPVTLTCNGSPITKYVSPAIPVVFTNVPTGSCTLSEGTAANVLGVTWGSPSFNPSATINMTAGGSPAVAVTNTASLIPRAVVAHVDLYGSAASNVPFSTTFPIKLTCGSTQLSQNVGYLGVVFTNVPIGTCTLGTGTLPTIAGVVWGTATFLPSTTIQVTATNTLFVEAVITANTSATGTGSAVVYENTVGPAANSVPASTNFPISLTCGNNPSINTTVTRSSPTTIPGLSVGSCVLSQGALPIVQGVTWSAPTYYPGQTLSIVAGGTTLDFLTNTANGDTIFVGGFEP